MLKTKTVTNAVHRTTITNVLPPGSPKDGGKSWLSETFKLINSNRQAGQLTVNFGLGGSISSIIFEEREVIPQNAIDFSDDEAEEDDPPVGIPN